MEAAISDFVGGLIRDCHDLAEPWRWRRPAGEDRPLARLCCWAALAHHLPDQLDVPNGPRLDVSPGDFRAMAADARALRHICAHRPLTNDDMCDTVEHLYRAVAERTDPPHAFAQHRLRDDVRQWAEQHPIHGMDWARATVAMLDFVRLSPLPAHNVQIAALLAAGLPLWAGLPLIHALDMETQSEDGFTHALTAGLDDDPGAWIAYALAKQRRALKRLPILLEETHKLRARLVSLFRRAPFDQEIAEKLAQDLICLPVVTTRFLDDTGTAADHLRDALVLLFAADLASEVTLDNGDGFTILPAPLRLLGPPRH